jgi:hypothetical protein
LAESSIQICPPLATAARAAGSSRQGCNRVQAFASFPSEARYALKIWAWPGAAMQSAVKRTRKKRIER